jgi:hypothetical protein
MLLSRKYYSRHKAACLFVFSLALYRCRYMYRGAAITSSGHEQYDVPCMHVATPSSVSLHVTVVGFLSS